MTRNAKQRIFVVDDDPAICEAIVETIEETGIKVICFTRAAECLEQLRSQKCDLLIADLKMPEMDGVELLRQAKLHVPWLPVLIITGYGNVRAAVEAMKSGAVDFIEKPLAKKSFLRKVHSLLKQSKSDGTHTSKRLTRSETKVLKLILAGKSNKDMANLLNRSKRTVETHRANIMKKFGVANVVDLVKRVGTPSPIDPEADEEPGEADQDAEDRP